MDTDCNAWIDDKLCLATTPLSKRIMPSAHFHLRDAKWYITCKLIWTGYNTRKKFHLDERFPFFSSFHILIREKRSEQRQSYKLEWVVDQTDACALPNKHLEPGEHHVVNLPNLPHHWIIVFLREEDEHLSEREGKEYTYMRKLHCTPRKQGNNGKKFHGTVYTLHILCYCKQICEIIENHFYLCFSQWLTMPL